VHFVLLGVVFCLDFGPFFFASLVPLPGGFSFIYLSIYLFIYVVDRHNMVAIRYADICRCLIH
jgi:hypothetical protein